MRTRSFPGISQSDGFTLVEVLIALSLTVLISAFVLKFYVSEHNNLIIQQNVTDMQQNLRACIQELSQRVMNAGANLPEGIIPVEAANSNPDTLTIRYAQIGGTIDVGEHTQKNQASPIHVASGTDFSKFSVGQTVFFWHASQQQGEWFTVSNISTNNGTGWDEIYHQGQVLLYDPIPGDAAITLQEVKFYVDASDTTNPLFMRELNGGAPQVYADNIYDFQVEFYLTNQDTVQTLTASDTAVVARMTVAAFTAGLDYEAMDFGHDGRRRRILSTEALIRNSRN